MPVTITELFKSREGAIGANKDSVHLFSLEGSDDDVELKESLLDFVSSTYDGMSIEDGDIEQVGPSTWIGRVRYARQATSLSSFPDVNSVQYNFDTTGATRHFTNSLQVASSYPAGQAPDFKGAIGPDGNGGVSGVDVEIPIYNWEETHILASTVVTPSYRVLLAKLTGAVNDGAFRGFAAGEVLFRGARGSRRSDGNWEISFGFSALPNVTGGELLGKPFKVGDITVTTKRGWDYMDVIYEPQETSAGGKNYLGPKPKFIYIHVVRPYADLDELNLPAPD